MMKTGRGEGENATQLSQREKNLNWPIEESWEADEGRRGRTQREKSTEYVGQVSLKVPVTLERFHCLQCLLSKGTYRLNELSF